MHHLTTMNLGACVGHVGSITARHRNNEYMDNDNLNYFYYGKNYRWILQCLDDGHKISMDLIEYMQDYCELIQQDIDHLISYTKRWRSKLKQQSSLSSYHTTKRAQLQIVRSPEKLAQLLQTRYDAIQQVITTYRQQVERMYLSERLGTVHKHYRSDFLKTSFEIARSPLSKLSDRLKKLNEKEKKAKDALRDADIKYQNLHQNPTTSQSKLLHAKNDQEKKQDRLQDIKDRIIQTEQEFDREQEIYRTKATDIYQQCRALEKERLDQIQEILIQFIEAVHSSEYSSEQNTLYENLLSDIKAHQDPIADLDFWAATYNVDILTKSTSTETIENDTANDDTNSTTTTKSDQNQQNNLTTTTTTAEVTEEQPNLDTTTTSIENEKSSTTNSTTSDTTALS